MNTLMFAQFHSQVTLFLKENNVALGRRGQFNSRTIHCHFAETLGEMLNVDINTPASSYYEKLVEGIRNRRLRDQLHSSIVPVILESIERGTSENLCTE